MDYAFIDRGAWACNFVLQPSGRGQGAMAQILTLNTISFDVHLAKTVGHSSCLGGVDRVPQSFSSRTPLIASRIHFAPYVTPSFPTTGTVASELLMIST